MKLRQIRSRALARQQHRSRHNSVRIHNRGVAWLNGNYIGKFINLKVSLASDERLQGVLYKPGEVNPSFVINGEPVNLDNLRTALRGS